MQQITMESTRKKGSANALGCTNVLLLNRAIYTEAIDVIHRIPVTVTFPTDGSPLFRHPLAQGKPNFFHSEAAQSRTYIHRGLTELEFIKLRRVDVHVRYGPGASEDTPKYLQQVALALDKTRNLREINLTIGPASAYLQQPIYEVRVCPDTDAAANIRPGIDAIITRCIAHGVILTATSATRFGDIDRIGTRGYFDFPLSPDTYTDPLTTHITTDSALQASNDTLALHLAYRKHTNRSRASLHPFHQPECRSCYAVFATPAALQAHLASQPAHNIRFRANKRYNPLSAVFKRGGDRHACLVCARSYSSRRMLDEHIAKFEHERDMEKGAVPRWREDNWWFTVEVARQRGGAGAGAGAGDAAAAAVAGRAGAASGRAAAATSGAGGGS